MARQITRQEWNTTKLERDVPTLAYLYTELDERLIFFQGKVKNNETCSGEALSIINGNNIVPLQKTHTDYSKLSRKLHSLSRFFKKIL